MESPSAPPSDEPASLSVDHLAEVLVDDLTIRAGPGLNADSLGVLPAGEPVYVVDGPTTADGYAWYQLASVREPYRGDCGEPALAPSLECGGWFGWAAAMTPEGDQWLAPLNPSCPSEVSFATFTSLPRAAQLTCAGSAELRLTAYLAPETGGRGCALIWGTDPGWLGECSLIFPQPEERQFDEATDLQVNVHPSLGDCSGSQTTDQCPFEALKGSWVEMVGHLDDPAAGTCTSVLSGFVSPAPYPPPDAEWVVFRCRLRFVVTEVRAV